MLYLEFSSFSDFIVITNLPVLLPPEPLSDLAVTRLDYVRSPRPAPPLRAPGM